MYGRIRLEVGRDGFVYIHSRVTNRSLEMLMIPVASTESLEKGHPHGGGGRQFPTARNGDAFHHRKKLHKEDEALQRPEPESRGAIFQSATVCNSEIAFLCISMTFN